MTNIDQLRQLVQPGVGVRTECVLLADYLKAIIMNQNVPTDLPKQSRESRFFNQYCPAEPMGLCRPSEPGGRT
jgi:hypothetical protein